MTNFLRLVRCAPMPRYLFHVRGGPFEADAEEPIDFADDEAARGQALLFARDLLAAAVRDGHLPLQERVVVEDQQGCPVASVTFGQAVGFPE